ncbi:isoprenoid synthase domain-containing protein [Mycena crocata]|nr:isoprenoid synthase domain-containing protein [Mycena crocata]
MADLATKFLPFANDSRKHYEGPYWSVYAICWPHGDGDRVKVSGAMVEALWLHVADVIEVLPHAAAAKLHIQLTELLAHEFTSSEEPILAIFLDIRTRMSALDPHRAPELLRTVNKYLLEYDQTSRVFDTMEEYLDFRILNVGYRIMEAFMRWSLDIGLTPEETDMSSAYYIAAGRVMALTNDFFSWEMDKRKQDTTDRVRNTIPVIMRQYALLEGDAILFLKGVVVDAEQTLVRLSKPLRTASDNCRRYVQGMEYMLGANNLWSATSPRYNNVPTDDRE